MGNHLPIGSYFEPVFCYNGHNTFLRGANKDTFQEGKAFYACFLPDTLEMRIHAIIFLFKWDQSPLSLPFSQKIVFFLPSNMRKENSYQKCFHWILIENWKFFAKANISRRYNMMHLVLFAFLLFGRTFKNQNLKCVKDICK